MRLNEGCNENAEDFLLNSSLEWQTRSSDPIPSTTKASLVIGKEAITKKYRHQIIEAWSSIDMRQLLLDNNTSWTVTILNSVDCSNLGTALTSVFNQSKTSFSHYVKLMNDMANTGAQKQLFTMY